MAETGELTINMGIRWSRYHLHAAKMFARKAAELEEAEPENGPFSFAHRAFVMNAITASVQFAEAAMNEIVELADDTSDPAFAHLSPTARSRLPEIAQLDRIIPEADKPNLILLAGGLAPLRRGNNPLQDFSLLVRLRNALIHSRPETRPMNDDTEATLGKLAKSLKAKGYPLNPRMTSGLMYPDQLLSAGCAEWALACARALVSELDRQLNVQRPEYERTHVDG
jgi:hypothetical protein